MSRLPVGRGRVAGGGMSGSWRDIARPIIARVIAEVGREDATALRRALREAYPFGERRYHPYKIWLDECKRQVTGGLRASDGPDLFA